MPRTKQLLQGICFSPRRARRAGIGPGVERDRGVRGSASAAPANLVPGCFLLGQLVTAVAGTAVTLAGNASTTISSATVVQFSNPSQQFYAVTFTLTSARIREWFRLANAVPAGPNSPLKIAANAVVEITYLGHPYVTASFSLPILQNIAAPDQF